MKHKKTRECELFFIAVIGAFVVGGLIQLALLYKFVYKIQSWQRWSLAMSKVC